MAARLEIIYIRRLKRPALGLIRRRIWVRRSGRKVELIQRLIRRASIPREDHPCLLPLLARIKKLELCVRNPPELRINRRRFGAVRPADDLDQALAIVDLVAQDLPQIAGFGAEDFLEDGCVTQPGEDVGDAPAAFGRARPTRKK